MESFFLSETCKYLYLVCHCSLYFMSLASHIHLFAQLFDIHHPINVNAERYLFTTEGHVIPITASLRSFDWDDEEDDSLTRRLLPSFRPRNSHGRHVSLSFDSEAVTVPKNSTHSVVSITDLPPYRITEVSKCKHQHLSNPFVLFFCSALRFRWSMVPFL